MLNAFDLLLLTVFDDEHVINCQGWVEVSVSVGRGDGQTNFFSEDAHRFLLVGLWSRRRRRFSAALGVCDYRKGKNGENQNCCPHMSSPFSVGLNNREV